MDLRTKIQFIVACIKIIISQNSPMLRICDLNQIIKHYAYKMQQRMEELQHFRSFLGREEEDEQDLLLDAIARYAGQVSIDQKDIKLAVKLKERVLQIFDFFKAKSNNQNVLNAIQANIEQQLGNFINEDAVRLGDMLAYVHFITKRGCVIKPAAQKRPLMSRSTLKPSKITEKTPPPYSLFNIQRRPCTSSKGIKTIGIDKLRLGELAQQVWGGLEFDRPHLLRIREGNEQLIAKEMLRRNQKAKIAIRQSERRKTRMETSQELRSSTILSELRPNSMKGVWNAKKRASVIAPSKKNQSTKENISLFT